MKAVLCILVISLVLVSGCVEQPKQGFSVAATFFPLYDLTKNIVGDKGLVYSIVYLGTEPHDFEPSPSDIAKLDKANAFVTMGIEFAEFEEDLVAGVNPDVKVIPAGEGIELLEASGDGEKGEELGEEPHGLADPHIWLSPRNAKAMTTNILNGLVSVDPSNAGYYNANAESLISKLDVLDKAFEEGLASCKKDTILVNHNAFAYLGRDYGFSLIPISGLEPEVEPTPGQLVELINKAKEHGIKYVFYEELVDPRIANTIADEVGAQVMELNPLEGSKNPEDTYLTLMEQNLNNLKVALECV